MTNDAVAAAVRTLERVKAQKETKKHPESAPRFVDDEELARRVAKIIGESSAAADAIRDLESRRANGVSASLSFDGRTWWVRAAAVRALGSKT